MEKLNRILAIVYALLLGVGETMMNWGNWQYAPLWVVDYFLVAWLLYGAIIKDSNKSASILIGAWAFAIAMMYMALAIMTDPETVGSQDVPTDILLSVGVFIFISIAGLFLSYKAKNV